MLIFAQIIGGLLLLVIGGEVVVKGAVSVARRLDISTVVIGLTIVAFGTSAPEAVISLQASLSDHPDIALGNVIGSNLANMLLVVGTTAILWPILTHRQLARRDGTVMMAITLLVCFLGFDGEISRTDGAILLLMMVLYTLFTLYVAKQESADAHLVEELEEEMQAPPKSMPVSLALVAGGIGLLVIGADVLITGASELARTFGISEAVIGVTIVAVGGSAPELVTSVVAAFRKHADIGLANIVGSNIFNLSGVVGLAGVAAPMAVAPQFIGFDAPILLGVTAIFFVVMLTAKKLGRLSGAAMFALYVAYIMWQYNATVV